MECVVPEIDVSGVYWFLIISTETVFLALCQIVLDDTGSGSGSFASQLRGFELRQLSTGGTKTFYGVESLDEIDING